jgi:hypothetical protein
MARPQNPAKVSTPISILKTQKARMRKYAQPDAKRKGYESDTMVLERILRFYEVKNPSSEQPKQTYATRT